MPNYSTRSLYICKIDTFWVMWKQYSWRLSAEYNAMVRISPSKVIFGVGPFNRLQDCSVNFLSLSLAGRMTLSHRWRPSPRHTGSPLSWRTVRCCATKPCTLIRYVVALGSPNLQRNNAPMVRANGNGDGSPNNRDVHMQQNGESKGFKQALLQFRYLFLILFPSQCATHDAEPLFEEQRHAQPVAAGIQVEQRAKSVLARPGDEHVDPSAGLYCSEPIRLW